MTARSLAVRERQLIPARPAGAWPSRAHDQLTAASRAA
jgi:hypothetical protein